MMLDTISGLINIAAYVLLSLGLYGIAKRRGVKNPWLAWIPVANMWLLGCISDQYQYVVKGREKSKRKLMLTLSILTTAVCVILVIALFIWGMKAVVDMGIMEMTDAQLEEMTTMDDDVLVEMTLERVYDKLENDADFFSSTMWLVIGIMGAGLFMSIVGIWLTVLQYMAYYDLFMSTTPSNATAYLLLSIFLGNFVISLLVFLCREKDEGMPPRREEVVQQPVWQPPVNTSPDL